MNRKKVVGNALKFYSPSSVGPHKVLCKLIESMPISRAWNCVWVQSR